jgi:hypothetical protein
MTLTPRRLLGLALLLGLGALSGACSSAGSDADSAPSKPKSEIHDPVVVQASAATRSDLGVETWGIYADASGSFFVRGYDASNALVVQLEQRTTTIDDLHGTVEISVTRESGTRTMRIALEAQPHGAQKDVQMRVLENAFAGDADARHVLDRIAADTKSQSGSLSQSGAGGGSSLVTTSVRPSYWGQSLIDDVSCSLNLSCAGDLVSAGSSVVLGAASCALLVTSAVATVGCVAATGVTVVLAAGCVVAEGATAPAEAAGCAAGVTGGYAAGKSIPNDCSCKK